MEIFMDNKCLLTIIGEIDDEIIGEALDDKIVPNRKALFIKIGALAACVCLLLTAFFPSLYINIINAPPKASFVDFEKAHNGVGEKSIDSGTTYDSSSAVIIGPRFTLQTKHTLVVEVKVTEILADTYSYKSSEYMVAKLKVIDQVLGSGLPEEIYFAFNASFREDIFDGIDSFIMSLRQIGMNDFIMFNSSNQPEYFPHMFTSAGSFAYGCELAFIDGRHTLSYIEKANSRRKRKFSIDYLYKDNYPVSEGTALQEAKDNIHAALKDKYKITASNYSYITESIFNATEESRALLQYVSEGKTNCFIQDISSLGTQIKISLTRYINGVETDEIHIITNDNGKIEVKSGKTNYTQEDLASCPDIGTIVQNLNLSRLVPPNIPLVERLKYDFSSCTANAWYKKVDSEVYGIIQITWCYYYTTEQNSRYQIFDGCYYLYDSKGNSKIISRDDLKQLLGTDRGMFGLKYNTSYMIFG
ncbi:MAG: hypothetical protein E7634_04310 [Ruminococcaceae bacterium]|nr:hypothetical protein [Oscillospiraceae bacterium]